MKYIIYIMMGLIILNICLAYEYNYTIGYGENFTEVNYTEYDFLVKGHDVFCQLVWGTWYETGYMNITETEYFDNETNETYNITNVEWIPYNCTINYLEWLDNEVNDTITAMQLPITLLNATYDNVVAHDYLYASDGYNGELSIEQMRTILHNIELNPDGTINKSTIPDKALRDGNLRIGVMQYFLIRATQLIDLWIQNTQAQLEAAQTYITQHEQRLDTIEEDLCKAGYQKYC